MKEILHFTTMRNWEKIAKSGFVEPRSDPLWCFNFEERKSDTYRKYDEKYNGQLFIVGIPPGSYDAWVDWGLNLVHHAQDSIVLSEPWNYTKPQVSLKIPVSDLKNILVREHRHLSKIEYEKVYGDVNPIGFQDSRFYPRQKIKYIDSTVYLNEYGGNYDVPEIWLPYKVPLSIVTVNFSDK